MTLNNPAREHLLEAIINLTQRQRLKDNKNHTHSSVIRNFR
jgi:hypothetical protein